MISVSFDEEAFRLRHPPWHKVQTAHKNLKTLCLQNVDCRENGEPCKINFKSLVANISRRHQLQNLKSLSMHI